MKFRLKTKNLVKKLSVAVALFSLFVPQASFFVSAQTTNPVTETNPQQDWASIPASTSTPVIASEAELEPSSENPRSLSDAGQSPTITVAYTEIAPHLRGSIPDGEAAPRLKSMARKDATFIRVRSYFSVSNNSNK